MIKVITKCPILRNDDDIDYLDNEEDFYNHALLDDDFMSSADGKLVNPAPPVREGEDLSQDFDFGKGGYYLIDDEPYYYDEFKQMYHSVSGGEYSNAFGDWVDKRVSKYEEKHGEGSEDDDGKDKVGKFLSKGTSKEGREQRKANRGEKRENRKANRTERRAERKNKKSRKEQLRKAKFDAKIQSSLSNKNAVPLEKVGGENAPEIVSGTPASAGFKDPTLDAKINKSLQNKFIAPHTPIVNGKKETPEGAISVPPQDQVVGKDGKTYDNKDLKDGDTQVVVKNPETGATTTASVIDEKNTTQVKSSDGSSMTFRSEDVGGMSKTLKYGLIIGGSLLVLGVAIYLITRKKK